MIGMEADRARRYPEFVETEAKEDGINLQEEARRLINIAFLTELSDSDRKESRSSLIDPRDEYFVIEAFRMRNEDAKGEGELNFLKDHSHPIRLMIAFSFKTPEEATTFALTANKRSELSLDRDRGMIAFAIDRQGNLLRY